MRLISADVQDYGNVPDVVCTDACALTFLGHGMVRVTFSCRRVDPDGHPSNLIVSEQVWSKAALFVALETVQSALLAMAEKERPQLLAAVH